MADLQGKSVKNPVIEPSDIAKLKEVLGLIRMARELGLSTDCSVDIRLRVGASLGVNPIAREFEAKVNHTFPSARLVYSSSGEDHDFYEYSI